MKANSENFLDELRDFHCKTSTEAAIKAELLRFLDLHGERAFGVEIAGEGHITSVARIENRQRTKILLVFGAKEGRWKMPDSHIETNPQQSARGIAARALRNANFEGGELISLSQREIEPYWNTPSHWHFELFFAFVTDETNDLPRGARWFSLDDVPLD
ncbi:MAG TPA: hypothetical protein VF627_14595 [Abditibacterium sp.]|jgi:hypothetical protein